MDTHKASTMEEPLTSSTSIISAISSAPSTPTTTRKSREPVSVPMSFLAPSPETLKRGRPRSTTPQPTTTKSFGRHMEHNPPQIIVASHANENQAISNDGNDIRAEQTPMIQVPQPDTDRKEKVAAPTGVRLNTGAKVAVGALVVIVILIAVIVTSVIVIRSRSESDGNLYHHHLSPDGNTVASLTSSSTESKSRDLSGYYRQAWLALQNSADGYRDYRLPKCKALKDGFERHNRRRHRHHHHREPNGSPLTVPTTTANPDIHLLLI